MTLIATTPTAYNFTLNVTKPATAETLAFNIGDVVSTAAGTTGKIAKFDGEWIAVGSGWFKTNHVMLIQRNPVTVIEALLAQCSDSTNYIYVLGLQAALLAVSPA